MAAKDYGTAVTLLQSAVEADPDSLRNASELRQAVIRQNHRGASKGRLDGRL